MKLATLIFFCTILLTLAACKHKEKNPCEDVYCDPPLSVFRPILRFVLRDANNRDFFFSQPPVYAYSQLKVNVPDSSGQVQMIVDTFVNTPIHSFLIPAPSPGKNKMIYLKMADNIPDTLQFDEEYFNPSCCSVAARLTNIQLNGKPILDKLETVGSTSLLIIQSTR
ncbi:MAG: hypothetical protein JST68_06090 [Bacteroidetes bacterium]|nr:hypothetical protein [Bacteroidota bacterium]